MSSVHFPRCLYRLFRGLQNLFLSRDQCEEPINPLRAKEELISYILQLARGKDKTFSRNITKFIKDKRNSRETNPLVLLRTMRQCITDLKNYLYEKKRHRLDQNLDVDVDRTLEKVLHSIITRQLSGQAYRLLYEKQKSTVDLSKLCCNVRRAQTMSMKELGMDEKKEVTSIPLRILKRILNRLRRMQNACNPLRKIKHLNKCYQNIHKLTKIDGADDLLPVFVWVLALTETLDGNIEADYMQILLPPSLENGIEDYQITTLRIAAEILINLHHYCPAVGQEEENEYRY